MSPPAAFASAPDAGVHGGAQPPALAVSSGWPLMQLQASRRPRAITTLLSFLSRSLHALSGFTLMLAAAIPLLTSGALEGGDQGMLALAGLGGGGAMLLAGRIRGMTGFIVPLAVAGYILGSSSRPATWVRDRLTGWGVELPEFDLESITSAVDPLSLTLIYVGAGLALAASVTGFIARFTRHGAN